MIDWNAIVNPASNIIGWYRTSILDTALFMCLWMCPSAFLFMRILNRDEVRSFLLVLILAVLHRGGPKPFWQGSLTEQEQWLIALQSWHHGHLFDVAAAAMSVVIVKKPWLFFVMLPLAALRIFL